MAPHLTCTSLGNKGEHNNCIVVSEVHVQHSLSFDSHSAGTKALGKTMQLCQDAKHALSILHLHMVCHTLKARIEDASERLSRAQRKLTFHIDMALEKGDRKDLGHWMEPAKVINGMAVLGAKLSRDLQAMDAAVNPKLLHELPPATAQQPPATQPFSAGEISLPQQWGHTGSLLSGARPSDIDRLVTNPQAAAQLRSDRAARQAVDLASDDATLGDISPDDASRSIGDSQIISTPAAGAAGLGDLPTEIMPAHTDAKPAELLPDVTQMLEEGCPCSLAYNGRLTPPKVMFAPSDIEGAYTFSEDPNLIVWDPDDNVAIFIDPVLYFRRSLLLDIAAVYPTAQLLFETDCDEQGVTLDHTCKASTSQHVLADLGTNSLPAFAVAGVLSIMIQAVLHDLTSKEHQKGGSQDGDQPGSGSTIWSRRLVYHRHLATDCLLGCVQICRHRADQIPAPLAKLLRKLPRNTLRVSTAGRWEGMDQPEQQADNERPATNRQPNSHTSRPDFSFPMHTRDYYEKPVGRVLEEYVRSMGDWLEPDQVAGIAELVFEHAEGQKNLQFNPPDPAKSPHDDGQPRKASADGDMELAKKLRDAQQQLERRFGSSSKAERDRSDRDLLKREKKEDRNRAAWAKLGKEPPPPKASKSNAKEGRMDSPPLDVPNKLSPTKQNDSVKRPLPTYASSQEPRPAPDSDKPSGSSSTSRATTKPAATPAGVAAGPQASAAGMSSGTPSQPAVSTASESKSAGEPKSAAPKHASAQGLPAVRRADDTMTIMQPAGPSNADAEQASYDIVHYVPGQSDEDDGSVQDEGGHEDVDADDDWEDASKYDAAAAAAEEAQAASEARQLAEEAKAKARAAAAAAAAADESREAQARRARLERDRKESEALDNATKLLE